MDILHLIAAQYCNQELPAASIPFPHQIFDDEVLADTPKYFSVLHLLAEHFCSKTGVVGLVPLYEAVQEGLVE